MLGHGNTITEPIRKVVLSKSQMWLIRLSMQLSCYSNLLKQARDKRYGKSKNKP